MLPLHMSFVYGNFSSLLAVGLGQLTLEQPEVSLTGTREKSVIMSCKVFSKDFRKDYIHWYRQKLDQGLEQLLYVLTVPVLKDLGRQRTLSCNLPEESSFTQSQLTNDTRVRLSSFHCPHQRPSSTSSERNLGDAQSRAQRHLVSPIGVRGPGPAPAGRMSRLQAEARREGRRRWQETSRSEEVAGV